MSIFLMTSQIEIELIADDDMNLIAKSILLTFQFKRLLSIPFFQRR